MTSCTLHDNDECLGCLLEEAESRWKSSAKNWMSSDIQDLQSVDGDLLKKLEFTRRKVDEVNKRIDELEKSMKGIRGLVFAMKGGSKKK